MKDWLRGLPVNAIVTFGFKSSANNLVTMIRAIDPFIKAGIVPRMIGDNVSNTIRISKPVTIPGTKESEVVWADIVVAPSLLQLMNKVSSVSLAGEITSILATASVQARQVHHSFLTEELVALYSGATGWLLMQAAGYESKSNIPTPLSKLLNMGNAFSEISDFVRETHSVGVYKMGSESAAEATTTRIAINDGESSEDILGLIDWMISYLSGVDLGFNEEKAKNNASDTVAAKAAKAVKLNKQKAGNLPGGAVPRWMHDLSQLELLLAFQDPEKLPTLIGAVGGGLDLQAYEDYLPPAQQKYYRDAIAGNLVLMYFRILPGLLALREAVTFLDLPVVQEYLKDQAWYNVQSEKLRELISWAKTLRLGKLTGALSKMNYFTKAKMGEGSQIDAMSVHSSLFRRYLVDKNSLLTLTSSDGLMNKLIGLNRLLTDGFLTKGVLTTLDSTLGVEAVSGSDTYNINFEENDVIQAQGLRTNMGVSSLKDLTTKAVLAGRELRYQPGVMLGKIYTPTSEEVIKQRFPFVRELILDRPSVTDVAEDLESFGLPDTKYLFSLVRRAVIDDQYVVDIANRPSLRFAPVTRVGYPLAEDNIQKFSGIKEIANMLGYVTDDLNEILKIPFINRFIAPGKGDINSATLVCDVALIGKTPIDLYLGELVNLRSVYETTNLYLLDKRMYRILPDHAHSAMQYITGTSIDDFILKEFKFVSMPNSEIKSMIDTSEGLFPNTI